MKNNFIRGTLLSACEIKSTVTKGFMYFIIFALAVVLSAFALTACNNGNTGGNGGTVPEIPSGAGGGTDIVSPDDSSDEDKEKEEITTTTHYTADTKISDVINDPVFGSWDRMIFPVNTSYWSGSTLGNLSLTWYRNINVAHTVEICNYFKDQTLQGNRVFYDIYTDEEKAAASGSVSAR